MTKVLPFSPKSATGIRLRRIGQNIPMNEKLPAALKARCCFGHLGGTLGNRLFDRLLELG